MGKTNPAFMSGVPELIVLRLLTNKEMYGYELVRAIRQISNEVIVLAEGVVYPALHSLEARGMLRSRSSVESGRPRVYYRTTRKGQQRLDELVGEWERISGGIKTVLGEMYA